MKHDSDHRVLNWSMGLFALLPKSSLVIVYATTCAFLSLSVLRSTSAFMAGSRCFSRSAALSSSSHGGVFLRDVVARSRSTAWRLFSSSSTTKDSDDTVIGTVSASGWRVVDDWESEVARSSTTTTETATTVAATTKIGDYFDLASSHRAGTGASPVEKCVVRDRIMYVKRDDLLRLPDSNVSGNKARKLFALNSIPSSRFPEVVVSYGGPQSNAMVALAAIVNSKNVVHENENDDDASSSDTIAVGRPPRRLVYYVKRVPRWLRANPSGNHLRAASLGAEIVELGHERYAALFGGEEGGDPSPPRDLAPPAPGDSLWIPQGGACGAAAPGARRLAEEISRFWFPRAATTDDHRPRLAVCLPGGSCASAFFLHRELRRAARDVDADPDDVRVVVVPCVGSAAYARRQMRALRDATTTTTTTKDDDDDLPSVIESPKGYLVFGEPHRKLLDTWTEMSEHGVHLDLLYGASAWTTLLQHWRGPYMRLPDMNHRGNSGAAAQKRKESPIDGRMVMYVHSGGLEGNASQMTRYKQKGLIAPENCM